MAAPVGATVRIAPYDWGIGRHRGEPPPEPGDVVLTYSERTGQYGRVYLIQEARLMARSAQQGRYALRCLVLSGPDAIPPGARRLVIVWYPRTQRRPR